MSDPDKQVTCGSHGERVATFVCQHLVRGFGAGFNVGKDPDYPDDPFPDAWCDACDARLMESKGEWNDENEAFAGITLICSGCYLGAQLRHEPEERRRRFTWTNLRDIEEENRLFPDTFEIAPAEERNSLQPGTHVKLFFELDNPSEGAPGVERMWVLITHALGNGRYKGTLANKPFFICNISEDDELEFGAEHVATIQD